MRYATTVEADVPLFRLGQLVETKECDPMRIVEIMVDEMGYYLYRCEARCLVDNVNVLVVYPEHLLFVHPPVRNLTVIGGKDA